MLLIILIISTTNTGLVNNKLLSFHILKTIGCLYFATKTDQESYCNLFTVYRTPRGLIWLDEWGVNRYAANFAFLMLHSNTYLDRLSPGEKRQWYDVGKSQIDYMLGDSGRSYVIGFGNNPPKRPHHRFL